MRPISGEIGYKHVAVMHPISWQDRLQERDRLQEHRVLVVLGLFYIDVDLLAD